ncbi:NmrA family NAD(P)-binding protein [Paraburkholderia kirstenboschensis]|uniref:NAD(P)H-binding protein n=1 Tax=Paraburkholderia kirstenboschensis TaxID=1245436 RepID=A0ABZ0EGJ9_9BURK|nr:NAD(P)H-binding protein [Paraburkholderia kirstenboschensis]WOD16050.1 NAD(P)H-binding protein [Paraburkholderia kirstenboschensis]
MFVIFGAGGNVGKVSAAALRRAGRHVRAVVRSVAQADALAQIGCDVALADLHDRAAVARALEGAHAVQILCPVPRHHDDPANAMRGMIDVSVEALRANPPPHVLALSDYGAEHVSGTGITTLFHYLETQLGTVDTRLTFLRAAEHMHNWARVLPLALSKGVLPSLHHPLEKHFPTVAAQDVGALAAQLLLDGEPPQHSPRVVSIESEERVSVIDVARTIGELAGRPVMPHAVPREQWAAMLEGAGLGEQHARLIVDLYDAHNAGRIDVQAGVSERRFGPTTLAQALAAIVPHSAAQSA